jgi:hypothetical protein
MKDVRNDELIRLSMKPVLTPEDEARLEAYLATHPDARATWEEERALGRALQSLPDVPVSSNFTARVLQAVDLENAREERSNRPKSGWLHRFWPQLSWTAAAAALLAVFGAHEYGTAKRNRLTDAVAFVSRDISKLPSAEVLRDFDAIEELRRAPVASDDELLIALQ